MNTNEELFFYIDLRCRGIFLYRTVVGYKCSFYWWRGRFDDFRLVSGHTDGPGVDVFPGRALAAEEDRAEAASGHLLALVLQDVPDFRLKKSQTVSI